MALWSRVRGPRRGLRLPHRHAFTDDPFSVWRVGLGAAGLTWARWSAHFYVYEWTLREDGLLETRTLLRRRVETISNLEHDKDEDDRFVVVTLGDHDL